MGSKCVASVGIHHIVVGAEDEQVDGGGIVPLMEVSLDLARGMTIKMDRCVGDVPVVEVTTGRAKLVISANVGEVQELSAEDVALAEAFAAAACEFRDELGRIVAGRGDPAAKGSDSSGDGAGAGPDPVEGVQVDGGHPIGVVVVNV